VLFGTVTKTPNKDEYCEGAAYGFKHKLYTNEKVGHLLSICLLMTLLTPGLF
jgi:hypothetical protein